MVLLLLNMEGPYPLTNEEIDAHVEEKIGNYALGYNKIEKGKESFFVRYVGRSDTDLNQRLKDHLGEGHKMFKFSYASTVADAYRKECKHYHSSNGTLNEIHPDKPDGLDFLKCPVCGQ